MAQGMAEAPEFVNDVATDSSQDTLRPGLQSIARPTLRKLCIDLPQQGRRFGSNSFLALPSLAIRENRHEVKVFQFDGEVL
jgi:hypothetical protein